MPDLSPRRLVRCDACGRSYLLTAADLSRFADLGWPKCHGRPMAHFAETPKDDEP